MPEDAFFPRLEADALRALGLLATSIHIYSFSTQRVVWANEPGLRFWNAASLTELRDRVLTPYSRSTSIRLHDYLAAFRRGEARKESWTIYPSGLAVTGIAHCRGVSLDGHPEAMLVEMLSHAAEAIPDAELRAIEALRHTPSMITMLADDGTVLLQNPAAKDFAWQASSRNLESDNPLAGMLSLYVQQREMDDLFDEAFKFGTAGRTVQVLGDEERFYSIQLTRVTDPASGQPATLWVQQDVSQLRDITMRLASSEATLNIVLGLSAAPSLLIAVDSGRLLKANHAARHFLGIEEGGGTDPLSIFVDDPIKQSFFETVLADGSCAKTARLVAANGRYFWAAVLGTSLDFDDQRSVLIIVSDIDELHHVAEELEVALSLERSVSEMQRHMLEIASHDFRTPLAVIDGTAQRIERRSDRLGPQELVDLARRIRNFVRSLGNILDSTIERTKENLAGINCQPAFGSVAGYICEVCQSFVDRMTVEIDEKFEDLPELWFDRDLFARALINMIENSIKYSSGTPRIQIWAEFDRDWVVIFMRDWGVGIPEEDWEKVFAERERGSNVGQFPGSGLGLFIARSIFRAHGGDVTVVKTDGQGTTMKMLLPRIEPAAAGN